ncbi:MAG TPA: carboxymuconolactone decarboxylase family protein [Candidatus Binatia bacterium]|nr:carboxymuconolactone decarboxylase family protein [Candidatus Binatia bacterium]
MARLPYVDPQTAPAAVRELLDRLPAKLNVFKLMAHAETAVRPLLQLGTAILAQQQLPARTRELAILRVARLATAEYEWVQHVPIARAAGVGEAQVEALRRGEIGSACFDAVERLVLRFVTEVVRDGGAGGSTVAAMQPHFTTREIVELVLTVGFYTMLAQLMATAAIDLDPPAEILGRR